jgi:hypothetical protein
MARAFELRSPEGAATSSKEGYDTVLSSRDVLPEAEAILTHDPHLRRCFQD